MIEIKELNKILDQKRGVVTIDLKRTPVSSDQDFMLLVKNITGLDLNNSSTDEIDKNIFELSAKLKNLEKEEKKKSELAKQLQILKRDDAKLTEDIDSCSGLLKTRSRLQLEMNSFMKVLDNSSNLKEKIKMLKAKRMNDVANSLEKIGRSHTDLPFAKGKENNPPQPPFDKGGDRGISGKGLMLIMFLQVFITIAAYLFTNKVQLLNLGFITLLINFLSFSFLNITKKNNMQISSINNTDVEQEIAMPISTGNKGESELLVNFAWLEALQTETQRIDDLLNDRLEGQNIDELKLRKVDMEKQIQTLETWVASINKNTGVSGEEKSRLKRELDVLVIERESLDDEIKEESSTIKEIIIANLSSLSANLQSSINEIIKKLKTAYNINIITN